MDQKDQEIEKQQEEEEKQAKPRIRSDGREVVEFGTFGACDFVNPYGLCVMRRKRPKTPEYDKPRKGCAVLEPKVNEPYEVIPRRITRKELLKKIRETFSEANIEDILKKSHGIDFSNPDKSKLSIPFFDDKIYEIYPNELWMKKAVDKEGNPLMLQAKALIMDKEKKTGEWKRVMISKYNEDTDDFDGLIDDQEEQEFHHIPKLFILFDTENPFIFAKRIAEAIRVRNESECVIKYNYYLSKIPQHEVSQLPDERLEKIMNNVSTLKDFKYISNEAENEINSVNAAYVFQLNKMMFDNFYFREKTPELCCINLNMKQKEKPVAPKFGKEMVYADDKDFDYLKLMKSYNLSTLKCKPNIVIGMKKIKRILNLMPSELKLFKTDFTDTIRIEEFNKQQKKAIYEFKKLIESEKVQKIKDVLNSLQYKPKTDNTAKKETEDDGKCTQGKLKSSTFEEDALKEYPILIDFITNRPDKVRKYVFKEDQEREEKSQQFMIQLNSFKTNCLIRKVNMMFQDALYTTIVNSLINFVSFFEENIPTNIEIVSSNKAINTYPKPGEKLNKIKNIAESKLKFGADSAFCKETDQPDSDLNTTYEIIDHNVEREDCEEKKPIFTINLIYKDGEFGYNTYVEDIEMDVKKAFDEGLEKTAKLEWINFDKVKSYSNAKYFKTLQRIKVKKDAANPAEQKQDNNANPQQNKNANQPNPPKPQPGQPEQPAEVTEKKLDPKFDPQGQNNEFVHELYERIGKAILTAKRPLELFLTKFKNYKNDLDSVVADLVKDIEEQNAESTGLVEALKFDIIKHQEKYDKILNEISDNVHVSYFNVNCKEIKDALLNKQKAIKDAEIAKLSEKSNEIRQNVMNEIEELKSGINKSTKSIEEVVEIEKFIEDLPNRLGIIQTEIDNCKEIYQILDEYGLQQTGAQFLEIKNRFTLIAAPTEVENTKNMTKLALKKQRDNFQTKLEQDKKTLDEDIKTCEANIKKLKTFKSLDELPEAYKSAVLCDTTLKSCKERSKVNNSREANFNLEQTDYQHVDELRKEVKPFHAIWTSIQEFKTKSKEFLKIPLKDLIGTEVQSMNDAVKKSLSLSIKQLNDIEGTVRFDDLVTTAETVLSESRIFEKTAELAVSLTTKGLEERHWNELKESGIDTGTETENKTITLEAIIGDQELTSEITSKAKEIADKASREFMIKQKLDVLEQNWSKIEFNLEKHKRLNNAFIITGWGDIYKNLDDDYQEVQQLEVNPFKGHYLQQITEWSQSFTNITDILESLSKLQGEWFRLQPIFESSDINKNIPVEAGLFTKANNNFREIIKVIRDDQYERNVKKVCNVEGMLAKINESNEMLDQVERGLTEYIEGKKVLFPRFYFLSNETLLKILSETKDLDRVKENLKNIFENIHNMELEDNKHIIKIISNLGEEIKLRVKIGIERKNIEAWMKELEEAMFENVKLCMEKALMTYKRPPSRDWIFGHTGQSVVHSNQNKWTEQVEEALANNTIADYCKEIQERINLLVTILREKLSRINGITVFNLLTLEVHNKDITELFRSGEYNIYSFEWKKQLRYYWEEWVGDKGSKKTDMFVKSIQTSFHYGYEYLGNKEILVITPLTDKCYLTLMGALKFNMGGAPAGPAGTGKTESTKDLAKSVAKQCVVYNCSEETDFIVVAAFFKGLACCGSWICFDEFNRINIEVLSVIASQLIVLLTAKAEGNTSIIFEKTKINILPTFCVFITMNPGYEGRTELPDNLVALFRPMAMMVPDYRLISEVYLYASGYLMAKDLATKITNTFKLSSEQLSSQSHYDFGMRAVKSVLYAAKKLKRNNPDAKEDMLLLRALRDVNVPKFLKEDIPLFTNIIRDLFPTTEKPKSDLDDLINKIKENILKNKLQPHEAFIQKIIQLYDTIQVRHGLMIVGPTGGGKTSNWKILKQSLTDLDDGEKYFTTISREVNPKSIKKGELFCEKDPMNPTEWINGIIPNIVNELNQDTKGKTKYWILFDGPVDTFWIEDMNSVLDDSKKLCLPSSAIIVLNESITMMFEVEDLVHASPATVSRCGMVFMEPGAMGLMPMVKTWLNTKIPQCFTESTEKCNIKERLEKLFEYSLEDNIRFLRKNIKEPCPTTDVGITHSLLTILECFLLNLAKLKENKTIDPYELALLSNTIHNIYFYCTIWSIGITAREDGREKFNAYLKEFMDGYIKKEEAEGKEISSSFPADGSFYDYYFYFDFADDEWRRWDGVLKEHEHPIESNAEYTDIIIPTIDSVRYHEIMNLLLTKKRNIITTGPTGTGKTINLKNLLNQIEANKKLDDKFCQLTINFSAQTTAAQTQINIEKMLSRKGRGRFCPDNNKIMLVFVDDLNMPKKEKYDAQPPIEILRQWLDYQGWYDLVEKGKPFKTITNIVLTGAMGPPGGGRSFLTNRFMRHFNLITYTELSDESIKKIFERKVKHFLSKFPTTIQDIIPTMVDCTLSNYKEIKDKLLPMPKSSHYLFNLRDMAKVLQGVCSASIRHTARKIDIIRLWLHEMNRCFSDRLICDEDRSWMKDLLEKSILAAKDFGVEMVEEIYESLENIIFCDFIAGADKPYILVQNIKNFIERIEDTLREFNEEYKNKSMPLVMFLNACEHVARISRIIRQTQGNALLLGVGGSGRQSIARLSSYMNYQLDCYQIEVIKGYRINDFRTNIKDFLKATVVNEESGKNPTCFLLCDTQIFDEVMLEDMNNILNSGDIPNIYKAEDIEEIKKAVHSEVLAAGLQDNLNNNMYIYIKRVLAKIHIILAMSPVGELFVTRLRMFPSLVNCCTIDWFTEWPEEALMSVAKDILEKREDIYLGKGFNAVVDTIKFIHKSVEKISVRYLNELRRYNYLTPTSFLEFLNLFQNILVKKLKENESNVSRYETGLKVLQFAEERIVVIDKQIQEETPKLEKLSEETEKIIVDVEAKKKIADEVRESASKESQDAEKLSLEISKIEADCAADLAKAIADLNVNLKKIDEISDAALIEVANYKSYGQGLILALDVLLTFKTGNAFRTRKANICEPTGDPKNPMKLSYKAAASNDLDILEPKKFKEYFLEFKNEERREKLKSVELQKVELAEKIIKDNNLNRDVVDKASKAIGPCFDFVQGMIEYCHTAINIVDPKKKKAEEAKAQKSIAEEKLFKANEQLAKAEKESKELEAKLNEKQRERNNLVVKLNDNQSKLKRARKIVELLSSEKLRWADNVTKLKENAKNIIGDCLIGAAGIAYLGPFISTYRTELEELWRNKLDELSIIRSPETSMRFVLEDKIESGKWNKNYLPNDNLSIENGIIMFNTRKWPLMIDPQNQASIFLKKFGVEKRAASFQCIKIHDPKMMDCVISGVKYGYWVMLDNCGLNLDNSLEPILQRQQVKNKFSNFYEIKIGEKVIPYNEDFALFMVTTMSNPHYSPETFAKITIINFAITEKGLEDQMLSELVKIEKPQLEIRKNKIIAENFENQEKLRDTEDQILKNLSNNKDDIEATLRTNELIDILQEAKENSNRINEEMKKGEEASIEINQSREIYRPSAKRASLLFFSLIDLAIIEPMYQFSLIQFKTLYGKVVKQIPPTEDMNQRLQDINSATSKALYDFTCRSLFEIHKPLFSFLMATKIIMGEQEGTSKIKPTELRFLLAGPSADIEVKPPENPTNWISPNDWNNYYLQLYGMQSLDPALSNVVRDFMANHETWYKFFDSPKNEHSPLPEPYDKTLTDFQKLILIKAIRFDKLTNELAYFVETNLGKEYTEPPTFNLQKSFEDSTDKIPLLFVLSTGSDPKNDFQQLAESLGRQVEYVSLGKSMDKIACQKIEKMKAEGGWVLLQNCHLAISFMPKLEDEIEKLETAPAEKDTFRLWLTSMSSKKFSISVLKSSIKITMEPPKGLKLNLQRQYENILEEDLEACSKKELFKSFFFALCFFHAIVQDRRKFGPIGWNIKYDFTNEDLKVSRLQLKNFLEEYEEVPYKVLNYLVAEINYGGRVTDDKDQRLIQTILKTYLCPDTLKHQEYKYSESGTYYCPLSGSKFDYLDFIKKLPLASTPEVFGMHDNAEIITAQNEARLLLETLLSMQPRTSSGGGKSADEIVMETLKNIESKTPKPFDYEAIFAKFPTEYNESMNTVLIQEVIKYNVLLNLMDKNLKNLEKALSGRIVMNDELEAIVTCLYNNQVPKIWITKGFLSLKPLMSWVADLNDRIKFFDDWYQNGTPKCFCISRFSFPQAFLTGTLQNFARKYQTEIDLLSFEFKVLDDVIAENVQERPEDGCYVYGMYLEGAKWNYEEHILDTSVNRELYTDVPLIHMLPVPNRKEKETGIYHAPLYKVLSRQGTLSTTGHSTNFVIMVELPSAVDESVWIKAGVAMFLALKQ